MNVFKIYGKIISKNFLAIFVYIVIALILAILSYGFTEKKDNMEFSVDKPKVIIINEDEESDVIDGFYQMMNQYTVVVSADLESDMKEALFYGEADYVIIIPKGTTEDIYAGEQGMLNRLSGPDVSSYSSLYLDRIINNYFDIWQAYQASLSELSQNELLECVMNDLSEEAEVIYLSKQGTTDNARRMSGFFNMLSYACLASVIVSIGVTMGAFSRKGIKRKLLYAPIDKVSFYFRMLIANLGLSTNIWGIGVVASLIVFKKNMLCNLGLFLIGNYFVFSLCSLSIAFLVFHLFEERTLIIGAANFIAVAMSFLGGVMVSQDMFNNQAAAIGNFVPTFWYVKANNIASSAAKITIVTLKEVSYSILMQVGFAVAALSVALVIAKHKEAEKT